jgi:hypothetical protein
MKNTESEILKQEIIRRNLAPEESLVIRELSMQEIRAMHSKVLRWHENENNANLTNAIEQPARQIEGKKVLDSQKAKRMWNKQSTPEEIQATLAALNTLAANYPQLIQIGSNSKALVEDIRSRGAIPNYDEMIFSFQKLSMAGSLTLAPENIGAGPEAEVSGYALRNHVNLPELLEAHPLLTPEEVEAKRVQNLSADAYLKENYQALRAEELAALEAARVKRIDGHIQTFKAATPDFSPTDDNRTNIVSIIEDEWGTAINTATLQQAWIELKRRGLAEYDPESASATIVHAGASTLISYKARKNEPPITAEPRSVRIADSTTPRRWTPQEIQAMDSETYKHYIEKYPEFQAAVDEYFA